MKKTTSKKDIKTEDKKDIKEVEQIIRKTTEELLTLIGVNGKFDILQDEEGAEIVIDTEDNGVIIGYHGESLEALQLILSLCVSKKVGHFIRISLEVGDYKKNRMEWLTNLALKTKERVMEEKTDVILPSLKSWERRVIHMLLAEDKDVVSESVGEGRDRTLVIKPR